jgi:hypothetical protein
MIMHMMPVRYTRPYIDAQELAVTNTENMSLCKLAVEIEK